MPDLNVFKPQGMLHEGWTGQVDDYALTCGWIHNGDSLLVGDICGGLYLFDGFTGQIKWTKKDIHEASLLAIAIHPSKPFFATAGKDGRLIIWHSQKSDFVKTIELGRGWVEHLYWSPDGKYLAASMSRQVYVFDVDGGEIWRSSQHKSTVSAIAWSSCSEIATASYGGVTFFDVTRGSLNQKLEWQGSLISMVLSPDGDVVACGSQDNSVHFWRRSTEMDAEMTGYPGKPSQLAFDQTGAFLATGGSDQVTVWTFEGDGPEGTLPGQFGLHSEPISSLSFANYGPLLASGSRDGSVLIWFLDQCGDGDPLGGVFSGEKISSMAWSPDDNAIATVNANGGVAVYKFKLRTSISSQEIG